MKIFSTKMIFGTLAAAGLMTLAVNSCSKKEATPLERAKMELQQAREQYKRDSLEFVNSDSVKAKEN